MNSTGRFTPELKAHRAASYDHCRSCGVKLPKEVAAYAGYASDGTPRYVGNCCLDQIDELASHIYWWWEADKRVEPGTKLWRYMDLAKFLDLLENRRLFFARADKLGDPFEGASGIEDRRQEWDDFYLSYFREAVRSAPGQSTPDDQYIEENARRLLADIKAIGQRDRQTTYVSCWHASDTESEALWRLYCPPGSTGIVLETTAEKLLGSLNADGVIKVGHVQYIDFRKSFAGFHDRIFWKRSSLRHESEVRAVFTQTFSQDSAGVGRLVDLEMLCVSVIPSPFAPPWFTHLIEALAVRYGVKFKVQKSELLAEPFF